MKISPSDLQAQYERSMRDWPFIPAAESSFHLPRCMLVAVGSRETNMRNVVGDGGHGHGVWQLDDRYHEIPNTFDKDVENQARVAAGMLEAFITFFQGDMIAGLCAYNAGAGSVQKALRNGQDPNSVTTGKDYGNDVITRMQYLQAHNPPFQPLPSQENDMKLYDVALDPESGGSWKVRLSDGAVYADDGAPYCGGLNQHPDWHAGGLESEGHNTVQGIVAFKNGDHWGYKIWTYDDRDKLLHGYTFDRV